MAETHTHNWQDDGESRGAYQGRIVINKKFKCACGETKTETETIAGSGADDD